MPLELFPLLGLILLAQGLYIFKKAKKKGFNHWLWGFIGLLNAPLSLIYFLVYSAYKRSENLANLLVKSLLVGLWSGGIMVVVSLVGREKFSLEAEALIVITILGAILGIAGFLWGKES